MIQNPKFLLIQLKRIGDTLMTTPAVRELANHLPHAEIHFLTDKPCNQIFQHSPYIHKIWLYPRHQNWQHKFLFWQKIRQSRFDSIIDFSGSSRSALLSWFSGAKQRIGFQVHRSFLYSNRVKYGKFGDYSALHKLELLQPLGITSQSDHLDFFIDEKDCQYATALFDSLGIQKHDTVISISPVSRQPYKIWNPQHFAMIADYLIQNYSAKILFLYGYGEEHQINAVRQAMTFSPLPLFDIPTLSQTVAILEKTYLHIGNDNGIRHLAICAKTPSLAIFGRPHAKNWNPPNSKIHQAIEYDPGCKNACVFPKCHLECLTGIQPEQVLEKVIALLKS